MFKFFSCLTGVAVILLGFVKNCDAQCGTLASSCTSPSDTICDLSPNDPLLWSGSPWYDPQHALADLAEGSVEESVALSDTCPGALLHPRFLLFLDLDGDGAQETALDSENPAPFDMLPFGNAGNPGYSGGTPRHFDARPLPDSLKWHFTLQTTPDTSGGLLARVAWNTAARPDSFVTPQLPLGRHKIRWIATNGLGDTTSCEREFWVQDCLPPTVACKDSVLTFVLAGGVTNAWAALFVQDAEDNITPPTPFYSENQIKYGIRYAGTGAGFPTDVYGQDMTGLQLTCGDASYPVEIWAKDNAGNTSYCISDMLVNDSDCLESFLITSMCVNDHCSPNEGVAGYDVGGQIFYPNTSSVIDIERNSGDQNCLLIGNLLVFNADYVITLSRNTDYLNGVSTFDLVLLSKHILGVDPLDSPYKIIAADVNRSNSVTTFDIVELRKLILGIYDSLPNNTSWRFIDQNLVFTDVTQPFLNAPFPDSFWVNDVQASQYFEFFGVKVGDLNCSVIANINTPAGVWLPERMLAPGEVADIPVSAADADDWLGFQLALRYDPSDLILEKVVPGALPGMDDEVFGLSPGRVAASWYSARAEALRPETPLFSLRVKALRGVNIRDALRLETDRLSPEIYTAAEARRPLLPVFKAIDADMGDLAVFDAQPNPTAGAATIPLTLAGPAEGHLLVTDASGKVSFSTAISCAAGFQTLDIPTGALPEAGVYFWRLTLGGRQSTGRLLRY